MWWLTTFVAAADEVTPAAVPWWLSPPDGVTPAAVPS
jgi:hypothetical protein